MSCTLASYWVAMLTCGGAVHSVLQAAEECSNSTGECQAGHNIPFTAALTTWQC